MVNIDDPTVSQADSMACDGLEFLENKWPVIKDNTEKVSKRLRGKILSQ